MVKLKRWKYCVPFAALCDNLIMMLAIQSLNTWHSRDTWSDLVCFYRGNYFVFFSFLYSLLWTQRAHHHMVASHNFHARGPFLCLFSFFYLTAVCGRMMHKNPQKEEECAGWQKMFSHFFALVCSLCRLPDGFHGVWGPCHYSATCLVVILMYAKDRFQ